MESEAPMIAAMVALSMTLVELVKMLIGKYTKGRNGNGGGCNGLTKDEHKALFRVRDEVGQIKTIHTPVDQDGIPLVQFPRRYMTTQKEIVGICQKISETQSKTLAVLDYWSRKKSIAPPPKGV